MTYTQQAYVPAALSWPNSYWHKDPPHVERMKIGKHEFDWRVVNVLRPKHGFTFRNWMFLNRMDKEFQESKLIGAQTFPGTSAPLTSACIYASMQILNQAELRHMVYESERDMVVDFRGMIQGVAQLYDVDPSEMMGRYSEIRRFLAHTHYTAPVDIQTVINKKKGQDNVEIKD